MKLYYYVYGNMGLTSSGSFTRDITRWITFNENEVLAIGLNRPYGATKQGLFILTIKIRG